MCPRQQKKVETHLVNAEALSAETSIVDLSKYKLDSASALTNTLFATVSVGPAAVGGTSTVIFQRTVSFARSYFEAAMRTYQQAKSAQMPVPNLLQEVLTSLNLGLSNLFGNQWRDIDKQAYSDTRQLLILEFLKNKPSKAKVAAFKAKYPKVQKHRTFALSTLVGSAYPLGKGWSLCNELPETYAGLMKLYDYCKDVAEHTEREKAPVALSLTVAAVEEHLRMAKRTIAWFLQHFYEGNVPEHARAQFREVFGEDF
jgi:hypothetical protein